MSNQLVARKTQFCTASLRAFGVQHADNSKHKTVYAIADCVSSSQC